MSKGPPRLLTTQLSPPYDVFRASPGHRASDVGRGGDLYPASLLTKTHMAEITWFWQQILGVDALCLWQHIIIYTTQAEEIRINLMFSFRPFLSDDVFMGNICTRSLIPLQTLIRWNVLFPPEGTSSDKYWPLKTTVMLIFHRKLSATVQAWIFQFYRKDSQKSK